MGAADELVTGILVVVGTVGAGEELVTGILVDDDAAGAVDARAKGVPALLGRAFTRVIPGEETLPATIELPDSGVAVSSSSSDTPIAVCIL